MYKHQYRQLQHEAQCDLRPDSDFSRLVNRRKRLLPHESDNEDDDEVPLSPDNEDRVEFSQSPPGSPLPQLEASSTPVRAQQSLPSLEQNIPISNYSQNTPQSESSIPQLESIHHDQDKTRAIAYVDAVDLNIPPTSSNHTNSYPHTLYSSEKSPDRSFGSEKLEPHTNERTVASENSVMINDTRETANTTHESESSEEQPESPQIVKLEAEEDVMQRAELIEDGHKRFVKLYNNDGSYKIYKLEDKQI